MADRFDKFTERARRALQAAQEEAVRLSHGQITAEHLVLGVISDRTAVATHALGRMKVNMADLARAATRAASQPTDEPDGGLSSNARKVIELAVDEARALDHHHVGTEHLLLGLVREGSNELAKALFPPAGALERTRAAILGVLNQGPARVPAAPEEQQLLLRHVSAFLADPAKRPASSEAGLFGQLADTALDVLRDATIEAQRLSHNYIGTEHILMSLAHDTESATGRLLTELGADAQKVRDAVEYIIGRGDRPLAVTPGLTPRAQKVLFLAIDEARLLGDAQAGAEHLLLAIIREGEGIASSVLESLGVGTQALRTRILEQLGQEQQIPPASARVSRRGRRALIQAQLVARWYYHPQVGTEHLLVGLVRERGVAARVLQDLGVELPALLEQLESLSPAESGQPAPGGVSFTLAAQAAIERATWEADQRRQSRAGSGHLLLGVLAIEGGHVRDILQRLKLSPEAVRQAVEPLLASDTET